MKNARVLFIAAIAACIVVVASAAPINILVNRLAEDTPPQDVESETSLVLGETPSVIVAFNDSGSFKVSPTHFTGFAQSTNGGANFTDKGVLPVSATGDAGDPVLARDVHTGVVYLATLAANGTAMSIFRSLNSGNTFNPAVNGAPGFVAGHFLDKEWIAVDNTAGAGQGNVYLVLRDFGAPGLAGAGGIAFLRSTNQGLTWGPLGGLTIAVPGANNVQGANVIVGPKHEIYVFWYDESGGVGAHATLRVRKSTNQGVTFGPAIIVANLNSVTVNGGLNLGGGFRTNSFPHAAVNPVTGNVYVVFNNVGAAGDRSDVFFTQSTNGGAAWSAPRRVNDDKTRNDQWQPVLAVSGDGAHLFVAFYDRRLSPTNTTIDLFGAGATLNGAAVTFGPNFRITGGAFPVVIGADPNVNAVYMGDYDQAIADNASFDVTWGDNRLPQGAQPNQPDVRFAHIAIAAIPTPVGGGPPPPPVSAPPTSLPLPGGPFPVFACVQYSTNLLLNYGVGVLSTHPQFCSPVNGTRAPQTVAPDVATATGLRMPATSAPFAGDAIFVCNHAIASLSNGYGIGVLTVNPQFCAAAGPTPTPAPPVPGAAVNTGLVVASTGRPIFRCVLFTNTLKAHYGVGVLTTHPQFCDPAGQPRAPVAQSLSEAVPAGFVVP